MQPRGGADVHQINLAVRHDVGKIVVKFYTRIQLYFGIRSQISFDPADAAIFSRIGRRTDGRDPRMAQALVNAQMRHPHEPEADHGDVDGKALFHLGNGKLRSMNSRAIRISCTRWLPYSRSMTRFTLKTTCLK